MDLDLLTAMWGIASGVGIATLGAASIVGPARRPFGSFAFGLFALFWGLQFVFGNLSLFATSSDLVELSFVLFLVSALPATYFLVEFAASQSLRGGRSARWVALRFLAAAAALVGALVLVVAPELLVAGVAPSSQGAVAIRGPLFLLVIFFPQFLALGLALVGLHQARRYAPTPRLASRTGVLLGGLGLYAGFAAGNNLAFYIGALALFPDEMGVNEWSAIALFALLTAVAAYIVASLLLDASRQRAGPQRRQLALIATAIAAPYAWGVLEAGLSLGSLRYFETVGLWRLGTVAVLAYGIARWRHVDLPQRTARAAASAGGAAAAIAGGAAAYGATTIVVSGPIAPAAVGLLVVGGLLAPGVRFARALVERGRRAGSADDGDAALYGQRLDAYRAALEASLARGTLDEDERFLSSLRERFGIDASEHRVLLHYARSSILLASTDKGADGSYERLRLLGEGGAGRTWLARDRVRDRLVVLKEPLERWQRDPQIRESVLREARLTARVRHPNVIAVEEVVEHKGMPILVMEYAEGGSLADLLRRRGALPWQEAVRFTIKVLRGVEAIHAAGIIHRDLKPSNVLISTEGAPKVADFGIAVPTTTGRTVVESSTSFAGTVSYMAPEVRAGAMGDRRSDVYACAALLYECIHGAPPGALVATPSDIPVALETLLARALAAVPERRPATARALAEELTSLVTV